MTIKAKRIIVLGSKIYLTVLSVCCLFLVYKIAYLVIFEPSAIGFMMLLMFSAITLFAFSFGLLSVRKVVIEGNYLKEEYVWGLFVSTTNFAELDSFKTDIGMNKLGEFRQLSIVRKKGASILVKDFEQNDIDKIESLVRERLVEDKSAKLNYWTNSLKVLAAMTVVASSYVTVLLVIKLTANN